MSQDLLDKIKELKEENEKLKKEKRTYNYTLAELIDRLSINQLKEVKIHEHKKEYAQEIKEIMGDIDRILESENVKINARTIRDIMILALYNEFIWASESNARKGNKDGNSLMLSHGFNGIRNRAKNRIQEIIGGRKDYKLDCLAEDLTSWEPTWDL